MSTLPSTGYEFGPYRLDVTGRSLECHGEVVALPPKAVEVLAELVKRPGELVGKRELMEAVWPETFVEEANLNQMIFLLRRALSPNGESECITTVPRRGYRFSGAVRPVKIPCRIDSLAVLPLANLSGNSSQEYFADGITEALIAELSKTDSLRVVSRTSVMHYKGKAEPIGQIARALRVQAIVEGSVVKAADRLRITVQLIHAGTDQHLWSGVYDGMIGNLLEVCSKNHSRRSCSDVSRFSSNASTFGRTGSIKSDARLSRLRRSLCNTPIPGSRPAVASANRDSASTTAYK